MATVAFAARLKKLREDNKYSTAKDFAVALGIDAPTYRTYERGDSEPNFSTLVRICLLLGVSPNDLLPGNWR